MILATRLLERRAKPRKFSKFTRLLHHIALEKTIESLENLFLVAIKIFRRIKSRIVQNRIFKFSAGQMSDVWRYFKACHVDNLRQAVRMQLSDGLFADLLLRDMQYRLVATASRIYHTLIV